jgi:hypothetical protein
VPEELRVTEAGISFPAETVLNEKRAGAEPKSITLNAFLPWKSSGIKEISLLFVSLMIFSVKQANSLL